MKAIQLYSALFSSSILRLDSNSKIPELSLSQTKLGRIRASIIIHIYTLVLQPLWIKPLNSLAFLRLARIQAMACVHILSTFSSSNIKHTAPLLVESIIEVITPFDDSFTPPFASIIVSDNKNFYYLQFHQHEFHEQNILSYLIRAMKLLTFFECGD